MKFLITVLLLCTFLLGVVDINTAPLKELKSLKGIGKVKAESIVSFRKGHCFMSVDDLTLVKGVGKKTLEKNRANLTASPCR